MKVNVLKSTVAVDAHPAHILKVIKRVHFGTSLESQYSWEVEAGGLRVQGQIGLYIAKTKIIPVTPGNRVFLQTE